MSIEDDICRECLQLINQCGDCECFAKYYNEEENMTEKENVEYQEIGRIQISEKTDVVMSTIWKDGQKTGIIINEFIHTPKYTGFTKGSFVPNAKLAELMTLVHKAMG